MQWYQLFSSQEAMEATLEVGALARVRAGSLEICLARTPNGLFAVSNLCSHRQEQLHKGWLNDYDEVVCPLHKYRFSLRTGAEGDGRNCPDLKTYPIELRETGIFIGI